MSTEERMRKTAEELIRHNLKNSRRYLAEKNAVYSPVYLWALALGFWVVMNGVSLVFTRHFSDLWSNVIAGGIFGVLAWFEIKNKRDAAAQRRHAEELLKKHNELCAELDRLNRAEDGPDIAPWWNAMPLGAAAFVVEECLELAPFARTYINEEGEERINHGGPDREITGAELFALCQDPEYRFMVNNGVEADKTYRMAELVISKQTQDVVQNTRTKSVDEVEQELAAFSAGLDAKERRRNDWEIGRAVTDDTRKLYGVIGDEEYSDRLTQRIGKEMSERERAYSNRTVVTDRYLEYEFWYTPVGMTLLDEQNNYVAHILYKTSRGTEVYCRPKGCGIRWKHTLTPLHHEDASHIIQQMWRAFTFGDIDPITPKAENFTDREWAYWVYAFYYNKK
ncbi:MAG: hypothetical protein IJB75_03750 [Oscillospiraceae bacterium]|nr:hypothetical protein [Oscillospiraceae bacterium]